jgi:hypothetical protein
LLVPSPLTSACGLFSAPAAQLAACVP